MFLVRMHQNTVLQRAYKFIKFSVGNFIILHNKMYSLYRQFIFYPYFFIPSAGQRRTTYVWRQDEGTRESWSGPQPDKVLASYKPCAFASSADLVWILLFTQALYLDVYPDVCLELSIVFFISFDFFSKIHLKIRMSLWRTVYKNWMYKSHHHSNTAWVFCMLRDPLYTNSKKTQ